MKKIVVLLFLVFSFMAVFPALSFAQGATSEQNSALPKWTVDAEVTFVGKNAARSGQLFDWTLQHYHWYCLDSKKTQCDGRNSMWYVSLIAAFIVLVGIYATLLIKQKNLSLLKKHMRSLVIVILLITFSYPMLLVLYQFTDLIQGFFLQSKGSCPPDCLSQKDLLYVGWNAKKFIGLKLLGGNTTDAAFTTLLLTKLTAFLYFIITIVLIMRKIMLWVFILISPFIILSFLYKPLRNIAKISLGEIFIVLFYAPLFTIFLKGLYLLWNSGLFSLFNTPNIGQADKIIFPTAVNILLGGPGQFVSEKNSLNLPETFLLYIISLILLSAIILLPWIILRIVTDYTLSLQAKTHISEITKPQDFPEANTSTQIRSTT